MVQDTAISWADDTVNFWWGCTKVNSGCTNCYAEAKTVTRFPVTAGGDLLPIWGPKAPRRYIRLCWTLARRLNNLARREGKRRAVFVNSMSDFFEDYEPGVSPSFVDNRGMTMHVCAQCAMKFHGTQTGRAIFPEDLLRNHTCDHKYLTPLTMQFLRERAFEVFDECQDLLFMLLTKRPENIEVNWPAVVHNDGEGIVEHDHRDNVWLGASFSDQATYEEIIPPLASVYDLTPVLWLSGEPLLDKVDLHLHDSCTPEDCYSIEERIKWVVLGGESKQNGKCRPCRVDHIEFALDQCLNSGIAAHIKQLGHISLIPEQHADVWERTEPWDFTPEEEPPLRRIITAHHKGGDIDEWLPHLQVREYPEVAA